MVSKFSKTRIREFNNFITRNIETAVEELDNLEDAQRVHLQKLVYTNLVDRFDTLVDDLIKINCREDSILDKALKPLDQPISEADLIRYLMVSENISEVFQNKIESSLRNSVLRERHSKKLRTLLEAIVPEQELKKPRVRRATGEIRDAERVHERNIPHGLLGYADYLYSRRNSLVHGAGLSRFLNNDKVQIKKLYRVDVNNSFRITYNSVPVAVKFYTDLTEILLE